MLAFQIFNEKIFILVWFWLIYVGLTCALSLLHWLDNSLYWPRQVGEPGRGVYSIKEKREEIEKIREEAQTIREKGLRNKGGTRKAGKNWGGRRKARENSKGGRT